MQRVSQQNSEGEEEEDGDASFSTPIANIDLSSLDEFDWCLPVFRAGWREYACHSQ